MASCTTDADCSALVTGHWCVEAATCDPVLAACVAWPRCRVTPWVGCSETAAQCVMARGPDGPLVPPTSWQLTPGVATGIAVAGIVAIVTLLLSLTMFWRRRSQNKK